MYRNTCRPTAWRARLRRAVAAALAAGWLALFGAAPAGAADALVAVAANFTEAATEIAARFNERTGHRARLSFASTGVLFTQISQGAPFDVFLAADRERPRLTVERGLASPGATFTYATGRIVLYSASASLVTGPETLRRDDFTHITFATPEAAPYGTAAVEAMTALGVHAALTPRFVQGTNINQTFQFVQTGNAELGFVALSQIARRAGGSRWVVPQELHAPIRQDAVLLRAGETNEAAVAFIAFLKGPEAAAIIEEYGYGVAQASD